MHIFLFGYNKIERCRTAMEQNKLTRYLSLKEVAEYINMSLGYVRELAKDTIGYYRFGCRIYVDKDDLDEWIAAQRKQPRESIPKRNQPKKDLPKENPPKVNSSKENLPKENLPEENQPKAKLTLDDLVGPIKPLR